MLDLEVNDSYLWVVDNLKNLLANHPDLRDFPGAFEPVFPDLYPSTIRDVEWEDMVAPEVEQFLSAVQKYVRSKHMHAPEESSFARGFVEMFRPAVDTALSRAAAYDKTIRNHARKVFGEKMSGVDSQMPAVGNALKSVFISYSWDDDSHREWVRRLSERLRADGVDVSIDRWSTVSGDQLSSFMEWAIRDNSFVILICTPRYKDRSDRRLGGVGYEGDIMTAEVLTSQNHRKFIPVLRRGTWQQAAPSWVLGKDYIDLTGNPFSEQNYEDLVRTLLGIRETAPQLGTPMATITPNTSQESEPTGAEFDDIKITRVIVEEVTEPRNDGSPGCALYSIPFALSSKPPSDWIELFVENWNHPPRYTTMHRPGIMNVWGSTVTLQGTTIEEVERYHRDTLQLAIALNNRQYRERRQKQEARCGSDNVQRADHQKRVENVSKRIKFD
jgi:hypothetical protein